MSLQLKISKEVSLNQEWTEASEEEEEEEHMFSVGVSRRRNERVSDEILFSCTSAIGTPKQGQDKGKRIAVVKKLLQKGAVSLTGAVTAKVKEAEKIAAGNRGTEYESIGKDGGPPPVVLDYLKEICYDAFLSYDADKNGQLDRREVFVFFRDFHEAITEDEVDSLFNKTDTDNSGSISFDEFLVLTYNLIKAKESGDIEGGSSRGRTTRLIAESALSQEDE